MNKYLYIALFVYLLVINFIGFYSMRADKKYAIEHKRRTPEKVLFRWALCGGALGSIIGMELYRHKTKHWYFVIGMRGIFLVEFVVVAILVGVINNL